MARKKSYQKGSVRLRGDEWTLRYREFDHDRRKWTSKREKLGKFKTIKDALRAAEPIMAQVNERNNSPTPHKQAADIRFREFIDKRWKAYSRSAKHQPSTVDSHGSLIKTHLLPVFGEKLMKEISPGDISEFFETKYGKVSGNTLLRLYALLHLMFDLAEQYDLIERSPVRSKLHKPQIKQTEKPTLSALEIRNVLSHLPNEQERLFSLLLAVTGLRMGEALALRWMDFNAERLELSINHTLYHQKLKPPKTESSRRPVRLVPSIAGLLVAHAERSEWQAATDFIFCRPDGRPLNSSALRNHLYKAMDKAKIERVRWQYGFHIFRHSAGSLLYARSRDLKLVQSTLGHTTISTTSDIYVHLDDKVIGEGTEILAEEILGNRVQTVSKKRRKAG
ncbi:MAG: tyrosine-type recombinase/integrase [Acidobacteriota bacterium]